MKHAVLDRSKWVKPNMLKDLCGYTADAAKKKRIARIWLEGKHWKQAPDGNYFYNWQAIDQWIENGS